MVTVGSGVAPAKRPTEKPAAPLNSQPQANAVGPLAVQRQLRGMSAGAFAGVALAERGAGLPRHSAEQGWLLAEIVEQAVLIAARDELGLPTRDSGLGDLLSDDADATLPWLFVVTSIDGERRVEITVEQEFRDGVRDRLAVHEFRLARAR